MRPTDEETPGRALVVALAAMAGVAVLVGLAVGLVVMSVVNLAGVGAAQQAADQAPPSLHIPKYSPTGKFGDDLELPKRPASRSPKPDPALASPKGPPITLFMAPQSVSTGQRINVNGVYTGGEGVELRIQRKEGGAWADFPVIATVRGGSFETWIQTTRTGRSEFRVYDAQARRGSNVVVVTVG